MKWLNCLEEKKVKKAIMDKKLAKSCVDMCDRILEVMNRLEIDDVSASVIVSDLYEALLNICNAILYLKGFKSYSHECVTRFLEEFLKEGKAARVFDRYRKIRNKINYYGKIISKETALETKEEILKIIDFLKDKYLKDMVLEMSMAKSRFVNITYFVHGTTTDNEQKIATGWSPGELSKLGKKQSIELRDLIKHKKFHVVFCSDLKRAADSARLTFGDKVQIIQDKRLRECNYGDLTRADSKKVGSLMLQYVNTPFPNGESYKDVEKRMRDFLNDLLEKHFGKNVAIVAHRAPQLALDVIIKGKTWEQAIKEDWRSKKPKEWKPGWDYRLRIR